MRAASKRLNESEVALKHIYSKVLKVASTEVAVLEGVSFDLMYVNGDYHRQYAFLRKAADNEVLLVVANFDDIPVTMHVTIPAHAFDFLKMKEKNSVALDLLSGHKQKVHLRRNDSIPVELEPNGAVVLKFKC